MLSRRMSNSSLSVHSAQPPGGTASSKSTIQDSPPTRSTPVVRICTVSINEGFSKDEVLMNMDLFDTEIEKTVSMVALYVLKADQEKPHQQPAVVSLETKTDAMDPKRRHLLLVKDIPNDLKSRYPNIELCLTRHLADSYGIKKGSQVLLTPVSAPSTVPICCVSHAL